MKVCLNSNISKVPTAARFNGVDVLNFHKALPAYAPTPLVLLARAADTFGIHRLMVKDEGKRFGLKAFKALGASYAVFRLLKEKSDGTLRPEEFLTGKGRSLAKGIAFTAATDGNHGRAVAWIARLLERPAFIFMPKGSVPARIAAIEGEGAEVIVVDGGYDEAVRRAAEEARRKNRLVIADTGYPGYLEIPRYIQQGYLTMFEEASLQLKASGEQPPDLVFIQAGVGAFASAAAIFYPDPANSPYLVSVEPTAADCLFRSAEAGDGEPRTVISEESTIMAGLNCETPSLTAWPLVRDRYNAFTSIEDHYAEDAMRMLASEGVVSGESGAAGLAALIALFSEKTDFLKRKLHVGRQTSVLVVNTEADTDPEGYYRIVGRRSADIENAG